MDARVSCALLAPLHLESESYGTTLKNYSKREITSTRSIQLTPRTLVQTLEIGHQLFNGKNLFLGLAGLDLH